MRTLLFATVMLILGACGGGADSARGGSDDFVYQNQVFVGTQTITAAASAPETGEPSFSWPATGQRHVVAAVFPERIDVRLNRISNPHRIVWLWHSGMATGREGNVLFSDGASRVAEDGTPLSAPARLGPGTYYWAVWALDEGGLPLASSIEYSFTVP